MSERRYPVLGENYALREVGNDLRYLMNWRTGDYYELEAEQLTALRLSDGAHSVAAISSAIGVDVEDVAEFFREQSDEHVVRLAKGPADCKPVHYRYCEAPHLSDVLIEVTGKCNLKCAHCFNSDFASKEAIARQMSSEQLIGLIDELDTLNVRRIQLSGGEPLLRKDIFKIIDAIDRNHMFLDVISTNATVINEKLAERLSQRFSENGALYISMDGLNVESYESLRGEGVFAKFEPAIKLLADKKCRVFINTMAVRSNLHEMDDLYDWMVAHPFIQGWRIGLPKVLGRYVDYHQDLELEFEEVILKFKQLLIRWLAERPSFRLELSDFFRTDSFDSGLEDHQLDDNPCKYAITNMSIKPDGTAVFCASLEMHKPAVLGNVIDEGLAAVWYGHRHMDFRQAKIKDLPDCAFCRYVRICGSGCRSNALLSYGDIKTRDPRACAAMQMLESEIVPELPSDFAEQFLSLIHHDRRFAPITRHKQYI